MDIVDSWSVVLFYNFDKYFVVTDRFLKNKYFIASSTSLRGIFFVKRTHISQ